MYVTNETPPIDLLEARIHQRVGEVGYNPEDRCFYLVLDNHGQYGYADLETGQAHFPDTIDWLLEADRDWAWATHLRLTSTRTPTR